MHSIITDFDRKIALDKIKRDELLQEMKDNDENAFK
jgi:hypothetical protein